MQQKRGGYFYEEKSNGIGFIIRYGCFSRCMRRRQRTDYGRGRRSYRSHHTKQPRQRSSAGGGWSWSGVLVHVGGHGASGTGHSGSG